MILHEYDNSNTWMSRGGGSHPSVQTPLFCFCLFLFCFVCLFVVCLFVCLFVCVFLLARRLEGDQNAQDRSPMVDMEGIIGFETCPK